MAPLVKYAMRPVRQSPKQRLRPAQTCDRESMAKHIAKGGRNEPGGPIVTTCSE